MIFLLAISDFLKNSCREQKGSSKPGLNSCLELCGVLSDDLFCRQFGFRREDFFKLCERCKAGYPVSADNGYANNTLALIVAEHCTHDSNHLLPHSSRHLWPRWGARNTLVNPKILHQKQVLRHPLYFVYHHFSCHSCIYQCDIPSLHSFRCLCNC